MLKVNESALFKQSPQGRALIIYEYFCKEMTMCCNLKTNTQMQ